MDVTEDRLLDGRIRLRQPAQGYRAGMDAALLAAACDAAPGERVVEAGCGAGAVLLAAAFRRPGAHFLGLENDPEALDLAGQNIALNGLADRVAVRPCDVSQPFSRLELAPFDAALCNPPFFDDAGALRAPHPAKRAAWITAEGLAVWCGFLVKAVRDKGAITLIHRADRLADIMAELAPKAGSFAVRPIHPFADEAAKRVIVRATKGGKAPLRLLPPLVLHIRGRTKHTAEAEAILRGEAALGWA